MKRIVLVLALAACVAACGTPEDVTAPPRTAAQPTTAPRPTAQPKPTARPRSTPSPRPTPGREFIYVVQAGDTLYSLARRFGVDLQTFTAHNQLADPRKIYVGQRLRIPPAASQPNALATPTTRPTPLGVHGVDCAFRFGFKQIYDFMPDVVGQCLEHEQYNANGDSFQRTSGGLLVWRKADNRTTFTDGVWTWIDGPDGLQKRRNRDRATWDPPDPALVEALDVLRTTPTGERIYTSLMYSGSTAQFGPLGGTSLYSTFRNLVIINEQYRNESPEALAHTLIWPAVGLYNETERSPSWSACIARVTNQEVAQAQWWLEMFGEGGKANTTQLEERANHDLPWLLNDSFGLYVRLSPHYREQCARYSGPPQRIDPMLARAYRMAMMRGESALGKAAAEMIIHAETDVVFGEMDEWNGYYSPSRNRIVVNEELRNSSADVLAAVLMHETTHVAQNQQRRGPHSPAQCVEDEIEAFKAEGQWWYEWHGSDGKDQPDQTEER